MNSTILAYLLFLIIEFGMRDWRGMRRRIGLLMDVKNLWIRTLRFKYNVDLIDLGIYYPFSILIVLKNQQFEALSTCLRFMSKKWMTIFC